MLAITTSRWVSRHGRRRGWTCGSDEHSGVHVDSTTATVTLKAGSPQHQHLVDIESSGSGTQFALVALDLPRRLVTGEDEK